MCCVCVRGFAERSIDGNKSDDHEEEGDGGSGRSRRADESADVRVRATRSLLVAYSMPLTYKYTHAAHSHINARAIEAEGGRDQAPSASRRPGAGAAPGPFVFTEEYPM